MSTNPILLDMLGETLAGAVMTAQARCKDDTIMARIEATKIIVSRDGTDLQGGLTETDAVAFLGGIK